MPVRESVYGECAVCFEERVMVKARCGHDHCGRCLTVVIETQKLMHREADEPFIVPCPQCRQPICYTDPADLTREWTIEFVHSIIVLNGRRVWLLEWETGDLDTIPHSEANAQQIVLELD